MLMAFAPHSNITQTLLSGQEVMEKGQIDSLEWYIHTVRGMPGPLME